MDEDAVYRAFGRAVAARRKQANLRQEDLGRAVGLSRASVANIERGSQRVLLHQALALAEAMRLESAHEIIPARSFARTTPPETVAPITGATKLTKEQKMEVALIYQALGLPVPRHTDE